MKILSWNIERPKKVNQLLLDKLAEYDADIIVLTETNESSNPGAAYTAVATAPLTKGHDGIDYHLRENRTTIWTKYKIHSQHKTFDSYTSVCAQMETPFGSLTVYGTIIGVFGGMGERFKSDLVRQLLDFGKLSSEHPFCIIGDLNVTFSGSVYPSHDARNQLNAAFEKLKLTNLTTAIENNVDHIVVSKDFIQNKNVIIDTWNHDKLLSDHIGICVTIT